VRFRVGREALGEAVAFVSRALPSRPVVPVLSGMLLDAGPDGLMLSCFDYEVSAKIRIDAEIAEPGTALVPGRLLAEITRSLPARPAEFSEEPGIVNLSCGSAEFGLVCLPADDYPPLPESPAPVGIVDGGALALAVAQVAPSASRDDTLPMLTAVCLDVSGSVLTLVATDRYRMAASEVSFVPAAPGIRAIALVPARTMVEAARTMAAGVPVTVAFGTDPGQQDTGALRSRPGTEAGQPTGPPAGLGAAEHQPRPADGMISLEAGGRRLTARLIAGEFIKYRARFPDEYGCRADMPAAPMIEAVRRAALVAERAGPVRLSFGPGEVVIEAHAEGRARAVEKVTAEFDGDQPVISFNPHYLLDGLTAAAATGPAHPAGGKGTIAASPEPDAASEPAGTDRATDDHGAPEEPGWVRLEFTSPAKPALITRVGDDGLDTGAEDVGRPGYPAYRYLLVPLRAPVRTS